MLTTVEELRHRVQIEMQADDLLRKATTRVRDEEYPYYSELYLGQKRREHEDTYAEPPEVCDTIEGEISALAIEDLLHYSERANLTAGQAFVWNNFTLGSSQGDITRMWEKKTGNKISRQTILCKLKAARKKIVRAVANERYHGWYIVYLETVTRRQLY